MAKEFLEVGMAEEPRAPASQEAANERSGLPEEKAGLLDLGLQLSLEASASSKQMSPKCTACLLQTPRPSLSAGFRAINSSPVY